MVAMGISFTAHTVMAFVPSSRSSHSTSLEMDISTADISSLPSSVGSARNLANRMGVEAIMDVSTMVLTDAISETPMEGTVADQKEKGE